MSNVNRNELHAAYEIHTGEVGSPDKTGFLEVNFLGFSKMRYICQGTMEVRNLKPTLKFGGLTADL